MEEINRPKVGTGIFILNDKKQVLFQKRTGAHGTDSWALPGGHLEWQESFLENAIREGKEETDLDIQDVEVVGVTNDIFKEEKKHYVTIYMKVTKWSGTPKITEPDRCLEMDWFNLDKLPTPMFVSDINFFELNTLCLCGSGNKYKECHGK
ncbi:MAG TPA: NUDIX domain-containing protein [Candidatus Paceibacterota bacterium]|jgi:8-oxo-dGTP diphosphatase|nr:NUDIX domain-containing protein [Candidatus Paceibacterota bacterium]